MTIFQRTGGLITADGSDDNKIKPEGIPNFVIPSPVPAVVSNNPCYFAAPADDPIPGDNKEVENNFTDIMNAPEAPEELEISKQKHCDYTHNLINYNVPAFHEMKVFNSRVK